MQHTRERVRGGPLRGAEAAGQKINLAIFFVVVVIGYVGFVLLSPRITAYELQGAIQPACRTFMYWHFAGRIEPTRGAGGDRSIDWRREWLQRAGGLGVKLREDQYDFRTSPECDKKRGCTCTGEAVFELETPWYLIGDYLEIPPYKSTHHVIQDVEWKTHY